MARKQSVKNRHLKRLRVARMIRACPTPWWVDELKMHRLSRFPPPTDTTPMQKCLSDSNGCSRHFPFYYVASSPRPRRAPQRIQSCEDCWQERWLAYVEALKEKGEIAGKLSDSEHVLAGYSIGPETHYRPTTSSPTAAAIMRMADIHGELVELELDPEDDRSLQAEIGEWKALVEQHGEAEARRIWLASQNPASKENNAET